MARIYGTSDSLTRLLRTLKKNNVKNFSTLESILIFRKTWKDSIKQHKEQQKETLRIDINRIKSYFNLLSTQYQEMIVNQTKMLNEEKERLPSQIVQCSLHTRNPFKFLFNKLKRYNFSKRLDRLTHNFNNEVKKPFRKLSKKIKNLKHDATYREDNFNHLISNRSQTYVDRINFINRFLEEHYTLISGAIGEQQVTEELRKLPDTFAIINDLKMSFDPKIFYRKEKNYILSIQIDHLVVGPSGVFIIETKNWSEKSIKNLDLFSPIRQIRRAGFALFKHLERSVSSGSLRLRFYHRFLNCGKKKITVRNILLMTNARLKEQDQFVKILSPKEIVSYICYFDEVFSTKEVETIVNYVMRK